MPPVRKNQLSRSLRQPTGSSAIHINFKEGDVIIENPLLGEPHQPDQARGVLLKNDWSDRWWTICFVGEDHHRKKVLDLSGIYDNAFEHYRLATPEERQEILSAMAGLSFTTDRGPSYFTRWEPKLETVIKPLIDQLKQ